MVCGSFLMEKIIFERCKAILLYTPNFFACVIIALAIGPAEVRP